NGLASLLPGVPPLPIKRQAYDGFTQASVPFNALGQIYYSLHPFVIGLGYFLPVDLTFSVGAFYWLQQSVRLGAAAAGLGAENPLFPYVEFQSFGAWAALFIFAVWFARRHLLQALRLAWTNAGRTTDRLPLSYRAAFLGTAAGGLFLCLFAMG